MALAPSSNSTRHHHTSTSSTTRVTRSASRLAPDAASAAGPPPNSSGVQAPPAASRKRKSPSEFASDQGISAFVESDNSLIPNPSKGPPSKRRRVSSGRLAIQSGIRSSTLSKQATSMANPGPSSFGENPKDKPPTISSETSKRRSSRSKKIVHAETASPSHLPTPMKRSRKPATKKTDGTESPVDCHRHISDRRSLSESLRETSPGPHDQNRSRRPFDADDDEDDDAASEPFRGAFLGSSRMPTSMSETLRQLSGYVSGVSQRMRDILSNMKQKEDQSLQLIALQDLSELLLISNEDNLSGHFSPDQFAKELISLMQPSEFDLENPEMMLLACRCLANLMEALPSSTAVIVYNGAVPVLCQKLLEINFIDLAEQALSTLEKISLEFPSSIVREGGLEACLNFLDFFATSTQRTAVTTAANCCKNIPHESFPVVKQVMPTLLNVLSGSDQKVIEQGSICVSRIIESFKYEKEKLEEMVSVDLLKAIRRLLHPGTTNLIGPNIHTQFLRVLSITARTSAKLSASLLQMDIVDTLFQILTGTSAPNETKDVASQIDSVFIMQALIHRPREQITETLNVICELLPRLQSSLLSFHGSTLDLMVDCGLVLDAHSELLDASKERLQVLETCKDELKRFAIVMFPTLTDTYSSTVNLSVRQKVLNAQLKMLSNLDVNILEEALRNVPFASFLASILSQEDHYSLVSSAVQAADLLLNRLFPIYGYQFYREGVMAEVSRLAAASLTTPDAKLLVAALGGESSQNDGTKVLPDKLSRSRANSGSELASSLAPGDDEEDEQDDQDAADSQGDEDVGSRELREDYSSSSSESSSDHECIETFVAPQRDLNIVLARKFMEAHENSKSQYMKDSATDILDKLRYLSTEIEGHYLENGHGSGPNLFTSLADYFGGDSLSTTTSAELLHSEIVGTLLKVFNTDSDVLRAAARTDFLRAFTATASPKQYSSTPIMSFIHKLQDLLSRTEHFEVITINQNAFDHGRSSPSSMLSKQLRLRLQSEDQTEIPRSFNDLTISIHAIATFKSLDDYLRPRISLAERPKSARHREGVSNALAAFAAAAGLPGLQAKSTEAETTENQSNDTLKLLTPSESATASQGSRRVSKSKDEDIAREDSPDVHKAPKPRRSTRRHSDKHFQSETPPPPTHPPPERIQTPLECADEHPITDDEGDLENQSALDAIVNDIEDDVDDEQPPEPSAVNMEVASSGKVTARKEDGTRVATPMHTSSAPSTQGTPSSRPRESNVAGFGSYSASRAMSYAAAIQSIPQDWHIEFSVDGMPVANDTTIYKAVQSSKQRSTTGSARNVWAMVHTVKFKRVPGPPPAESTLASRSEKSLGKANIFKEFSLKEHPQTLQILRLLDIFHEMSANVEDLLDNKHQNLSVNETEVLSQFVNTKLTAKLNRQLEEPLIVASDSLPSWSEDLARQYPFLFPFETRHLFLQSTSFGYSRSMMRWQSQSGEESQRDRHREERPFMGKLQRQKVRIQRQRILESAYKVMELYGASSSILEIEYFDEVGTGLGPTLEFYSTVSREFSKRKMKMWRTSGRDEHDEYLFGSNGMFPAPMTDAYAESESGKKILYHFRTLGKFIARSMLDSRIIDVAINPVFFRIGDEPGPGALSLGSVRLIDHQLAASLKLLKQYAAGKKDIGSNRDLNQDQKAECIARFKINDATLSDLGLDFTLPGYPHIELIENGANIAVDMDNVGLFVERVVDMTLGRGVQRQISHFRAGFSEVFSYDAMKAFTAQELTLLFGRAEEDWSLETLCDSIKADHGYNMDSKSVRNLLQVMSELSLPQRREFLQFVTGSPKLPIGGFKALNPMFTVVCKPSEAPYVSDDFLISVMTCANYVKLPDYSSMDILRSRLLTAISEGQGAFHLS